MGFGNMPMDQAEGLKAPKMGVWVYEPHMQTWFYVSPSAPDFKEKVINEANNLQGAFINRLKPLGD